MIDRKTLVQERTTLINERMDLERRFLDINSRLEMIDFQLSPVANVPVEIIREIMHAVLYPSHSATGGFSQIKHPGSDHALLEVCKSWREVAISTPEFWSNIAVEDGEVDVEQHRFEGQLSLLELRLGRASHCLNVSWYGSEHHSTILALLSKRVEHWRVLDLGGMLINEIMDVLAAASKARSPSLHTLKVEDSLCFQMERPAPIFNLPTLRRLCIEEFDCSDGIRSIRAPLLEQLETFFPHRLTNLIARCNRRRPFHEPLLEPWSMPSVTCLTFPLEQANLLHSLRLPALKHLILQDDRQHWPIPEIIEIIPSSIARSVVTLTWQLDRAYRSTDAETVLRPFVNMEQLIVDVDCWHSHAKILVALSEVNAEPLCTKLQTITLNKRRLLLKELKAFSRARCSEARDIPDGLTPCRLNLINCQYDFKRQYDYAPPQWIDLPDLKCASHECLEQLLRDIDWT
jgi:hypothetical protein